MKRHSLLLAVALGLVVLALADSRAQGVRWIVGGRIGMSYASMSTGGGGGTQYFDYTTWSYKTTGSSSSTKSAGLQIGPTAEVIFARQFAVCEEFNINTQSGTPIEWASTFKAYFNIHNSGIRPYADAGFNLLFITGGPYFGIRAGGGAMFPIAKDLYIPADFQLGPIFTTGSTTFFFAITTGIRYVI